MVLIRQPARTTGGAGGATVTTQIINLSTGDFTTTSAVYVDVTGVVLTLPTRAGGFAIIVWSPSTTLSVSAISRETLADDGVDRTPAPTKGTTGLTIQCVQDVIPLDGSVIQARTQTSAGTLTMRLNADAGSRMVIFEVS